MMGRRQKHWISLPLVLSLVYGYVLGCPTECECGYINGTTYQQVDCSGRGIDYIPTGIPVDTFLLDLSDNAFTNFSDTALRHIRGLEKLDLRENTHLGDIPHFYDNTRMRRIFVDSGFTCCTFEMEYDFGKESENKTEPLKCRATEPYTECSRNLLQVFTIVIYAIVVPFSFVFNPWIIIVTYGCLQRRNDPITFNAFHFSTANLLTTIYAAVLLGKGIRFHGDYYDHMEDWLTDPGCSLVGCMLLVSTLVSAILYMIEVICMFMKLRYPLKVDRHMTIKKLNLTVLGTWTFALFIGIIPFMTKRSFNAVGLCVPFYNDGVLPFKYVIFYTVIMGATVIVNSTLAILLLRSFMKNRKRRHDEIPTQLMRDLLAVEKVILIALSVYIAIAIVNVSFLIVSCVGGTAGKVGREWYTRLVVLETVTYPLVGPLRRKKFYQDTVRLLQKWGCLSYEGGDPYSEGSFALRLLSRSSTRRSNNSKLAANSFNTGSSRPSMAQSKLTSDSFNSGQQTPTKPGTSGLSELRPIYYPSNNTGVQQRNTVRNSNIIKIEQSDETDQEENQRLAVEHNISAESNDHLELPAHTHYIRKQNES